MAPVVYDSHHIQHETINEATPLSLLAHSFVRVTSRRDLKTPLTSTGRPPMSSINLWTLRSTHISISTYSTGSLAYSDQSRLQRPPLPRPPSLWEHIEGCGWPGAREEAL